MIEVLAAIGGVGTVGLAAAVVVLAFRYAGAVSDQLAARDMLDGERVQLSKTRGELTAETAAHDVTKKLVEKERKLREDVEMQRNEAFRRAREYYAGWLSNAGVGDAIVLVDRLLSLPLPVAGVGDPIVHEEVVPAGDPNRTDDDLLRP